jgi:hypothetical protein
MITLFDQVYINAKQFKGQRKGQALMNALFGINQNLYNKINQTEADCFYNDANIPRFDTVVQEVSSKEMLSILGEG